MKYRLLNINFLFIFGFIFAEGYLGWSADAIDDRAGKYNTLILAQSWLPTFCFSTDRRKLYKFCEVVDKYERWSIHGLWPIGIENCDTTPLDMDQISEKTEQLKNVWVDAYSINENNGLEHNFGYDLWKDEWLKHGTCAFDKKEKNVQAKYFALAVSYFQKFSLTAFLADKDIIPSKDKSYSWYAISDALKDRLPEESYILYCRLNEKEDKQYLFEIRVCFTKNQTPTKCKARTTLGLCMRSMPIIFPDGNEVELFAGTNSRGPGTGPRGPGTGPRDPGTGSKGPGAGAQKNNWRYNAPSRADLSQNWRAQT